MQGLEFLAALRKRWPYIVVPIVLGLVAAIGLTASTTPVYQATSSVYFSLPTFSNSANDLFQGSNYTQNQLASYATLVTKPIVLDPVIKQLGLKRTAANLAGSVDTVASSDTVLLDISVSDPSAAQSAQISNAIATQLGVTVRALAPKSTTGQLAVDAFTVAQAVPPSKPIKPNRTKNWAAGGLGGLLLGLVLAIGREKLDTRVRVAKDLPPGVSALTSIGFDKTAKKFPVVDEGHRRRAEPFRQLRTSLQFVDVDRPVKVVVVTSSVPGEGKSSTAANLAIVFAEAGQRVLLIEADMRRPRVSNYLGLDRTVGLTDVLAGHAKLDDVLQTWGSGQLAVLPSGSIPPNPSELLGSQSMADLMARMRIDYDFVILDTPPLLPVTDAAVASAHADGVVVVARYGKVTRDYLAETVKLLRAVDARLLGAVINMAPVKGADAARYDGYGYYEDAPSKKSRRSGGSDAGADPAAPSVIPIPAKPLVPAAVRPVRSAGMRRSTAVTAVGDAVIRGDAVARGDALISGDAMVDDDADATGAARVRRLNGRSKSDSGASIVE